MVTIAGDYRGLIYGLTMNMSILIQYSNLNGGCNNRSVTVIFDHHQVTPFSQFGRTYLSPRLLSVSLSQLVVNWDVLLLVFP